ncbi:MAG: protein kinase [Elusimicrobia bacterium]|nr:protein kinase [Elusimicrobiota bacterium]
MTASALGWWALLLSLSWPAPAAGDIGLSVGALTTAVQAVERKQRLAALIQAMANAPDREARRRHLTDIQELYKEMGVEPSLHDPRVQQAAHIDQLEEELAGAVDPDLRARLSGKIELLRAEAPAAPPREDAPVEAPPAAVAAAPALVYPQAMSLADRDAFRGAAERAFSDEPIDQRTEDAADRLQERFPNDPGVNMVDGVIALRQGDYPRADRLFGAAIGGGSDNPDLYYLRGAANLNLGRTPQAAADLNRALKLDPGHVNAKDLLMLAQNKVAPTGYRVPLPWGTTARPAGVRAARYEEPAPAEAAPAETAAILMRSAQEQARVGDKVRAVATLQKAVRAEPANPAPRLLLTEALLKGGRFSEAEGEATRLLEFSPNHVGALNLRATARDRLGDYAGALRDTELSLRLMPQSALGHWARAYALAGLKRRVEAQAEAAQAAALDERFAPVSARLAALAEDADPLVAFAETAGGGERTAAAAAPSDPLRVSLAAAGAALTSVGLVLFALRRRRPEAVPQRREAHPAESDAEIVIPERAPRSAPPSASQTLGPGALLAGNYMIESELGRGTMGVVFKAQDLTLKRTVAIKMLRQYSRGRAEPASQLLQEAQLVAGLKHPNIVQIHTVVSDGDDLLLVFEYVDGRTLSDLLADFGHLPLRDAQAVVRQAAEAIDHAHAGRVIHRDLKPANIMVQNDGKVLVMDFGLAHQARLSASKQTNAACWGSPAYMPPEQELGSVSAASDVYALGACFYEIVTGSVPFPGPDGLGQKQRMQFTPPCERMPSLPPVTDAVLRRALHARPDQRFQTAREFAQAVGAL